MTPFRRIGADGWARAALDMVVRRDFFGVPPDLSVEPGDDIRLPDVDLGALCDGMLADLMLPAGCEGTLMPSANHAGVERGVERMSVLDAYQEGHRAQRDGVPQSHNPYTVAQGARHRCWKEGWASADDRRSEDRHDGRSS